MGLFNRKSAPVKEQRSLRDGLIESWGGKSLIDWNTKNILSIPVVAESVKLISGSIASMPIYVYKEDKNYRVSRKTHYLERLLNEDTSYTYNGYQFKSDIARDILLYGKSYFYVERKGNTIEGIHHVNYNTVSEINLLDKKGTIRGKTINYTLNNIVCQASETDFLIIDSGNLGVLNSRDILELMMQHSEMVKTSFDNTVRPTGVLKSASRLSKESIARLRESWSNLYQGSKNAGKTIILEEGLEYQSLTANFEGLQLNETKKSFVEDVERLFNLYDVKGNDELYLKRTLAPLINCIESAINSFLLLEREKENGYFVRFATDELLRPSAEVQFKMYGEAVSSGLMSIEESRARLDLPSFFVDENSDKLLLSLGHVLVDRENNITIPNMGTAINQEGSEIDDKNINDNRKEEEVTV